MPKNEKGAEEYYTSMFTELRWIIADDKRIPNFDVLFLETIKTMLDDSPSHTVAFLVQFTILF